MHSPILQQVQMVLSGKKNWRFMDEPTSAPETCAEGAFPRSCSDAFNVFGPLSLYSIIFPSEEKLGQSLLYEFCCGPFEIM